MSRLLPAATALLTWIVSASCGPAQEANATCVTSEERACTGMDGCTGTQRCADGAWTSCTCRSEESEPPHGDRPALGATCTSEGDCPPTARCLREEGDDLFGGGPPGGSCVADCSQDPSVCEAFVDAVCVAIGSEQSYCFPACLLGDGNFEKCGERSDVACEALDEAGAGFCRPLCSRDSDCADRRCDRRHGVCVSDSSNVSDFGSPCTPDADETDCSGICVQIGGNDTGICSHRCTYGSTDSCSSAEEAPSLCAFATPGGSLGDVGYCAELCDCTRDCSHPDDVCDPFTSEGLRDLLGKAGLCAPPIESDPQAEPLACPD